MSRPGIVPLAALLLAAAASGCEVALDPIQETDRTFSLSGVLDASADTQWVRVEPVTPSLDREPGLTGTEVTLERLSDGRTVRLEERLRPFRSSTAHLFWTTEPVGLGASYRLRARGPGGEATTTVRTPDRAPDLTVFGGPRDDAATVVVRDVDRLVDALALYTFAWEGVPAARLSHLDRAVLREDGSYSVGVYPARDREVVAGGAPLAACEALVAAGSDDWEGITGLGRESIAVENLTGRVEGGVGFVGGVATARAPVQAGPCPGLPDERP